MTGGTNVAVMSNLALNARSEDMSVLLDNRIGYPLAYRRLPKMSDVKSHSPCLEARSTRRQLGWLSNWSKNQALILISCCVAVGLREPNIRDMLFGGPAF